MDHLVVFHTLTNLDSTVPHNIE